VVRNDAAASRRQSIGKEIPLHESGEYEQWVGSIAGGHTGHLSEEGAENGHLDKWLQNSPRRSQDRLLVSNLDVTPNQEVKQLAISPELLEIGDLPA
jgi:hypothetical protein